ncbi:MAG: glycosyltransferase [Thermoplasmatales archaeon]|nr:glycosyltransferase [Thermoplasmatales archaeon]MCW6170298.1 glycosyltransferase [Thermoplasmatales archaeon]
MPIKYSICTTSYRSVSLVEDFIDPLLSLGDNYEIVVVDNDSDDGTFEKLKAYPERVLAISKKCTRGKGFQTAIDLSHGEIIIHIEFDVGYVGLYRAVEYYEKSDTSKIFYYIIPGKKCNATLYVGRRELFKKVGNFPDLNYAEDLYFNKKANKLNLLKVVSLDVPIKCLEIKGMGSGSEARYENNVFRRIQRRVIATRDILFVNNIGYSELMVKYKLKGSKAIFVGLPEYLLGRLLRFTIKDPPLD